MIIIYIYKKILGLIRYQIRKKKYVSITRKTYIADEKMITPKYISIGNALIWHNCRIEGVRKYNDKYYTPLIQIRDGVRIQQNVHITCANSIIIGNNTCISANVTITDINHPYTDINKPVEYQDLEVKSVYIGNDSKIYNGAVILPGVNIGKHSVIGANTVVTKNIPDYCIAVGAPAYIIKRYNFDTQQWVKTDKQGNFANENKSQKNI